MEEIAGLFGEELAPVTVEFSYSENSAQLDEKSNDLRGFEARVEDINEENKN